MKSDVKDLQIDSHCALFKKNVGSPAIKESEYCHSLIHRKEGDLIGELGSLGFRLRPCVFLPAYYHTTAQHFFLLFKYLSTNNNTAWESISPSCAVIDWKMKYLQKDEISVILLSAGRQPNGLDFSNCKFWFGKTGFHPLYSVVKG